MFRIVKTYPCGGTEAEYEAAAKSRKIVPDAGLLNYMQKPDATFVRKQMVLIHFGVNAQRKREGLQPYLWDRDLVDLAQGHSDDMASHAFIDHISPRTGGHPDRARAKKYRCALLGENIAAYGHPSLRNPLMTDPNVGAKLVVDGWLNSPGHKKNMLHREMLQHGIGVTQGRFKADDGSWITGYYITAVMSV